MLKKYKIYKIVRKLQSYETKQTITKSKPKHLLMPGVKGALSQVSMR